MGVLFPFSAIVGQHEMKLAIFFAATAMRAIGVLSRTDVGALGELPEIDRRCVVLVPVVVTGARHQADEDYSL